jgi:class 3 adenylate cyclase
MGANEIGTARALREHRAAIDPVAASHGGRIVKTIGDGVLLELSLHRGSGEVRRCDPESYGGRRAVVG